MSQAFWLVKQEPGAYPWHRFVADGGTAWTGVRSFPARNHLRAMKAGDCVLFYHTGSGKEVVGIARVAKAAYPDPTAEEGDWSSVDLVPVKRLSRPVPLATVKADPALRTLALVRQPRLSVMPLTPGQFARVLKLAETRP
jgi:predicted RNA-binding protein with PUA-like domain